MDKIRNPTGKTGLAKFIPALPLDPTNSSAYLYTYGATVSDYELNAVMESVDNAVKMSTDGGIAQPYMRLDIIDYSLNPNILVFFALCDII